MNPHSRNLRRIAEITKSPDIRIQLEAAANALDELDKAKVFDFGILNEVASRLDELENRIKGCATRMDLEILEMQLNRRG